MAEEIQEPDDWKSVEDRKDFQELPYEHKAQVFDAWKSNLVGYAKTKGARDEDIQGFIPKATQNFETKYFAPALAQTQGQLLAAANDPLDMGVLSKIRTQEEQDRAAKLQQQFGSPPTPDAPVGESGFFRSLASQAASAGLHTAAGGLDIAADFVPQSGKAFDPSNQQELEAITAQRDALLQRRREIKDLSPKEANKFRKEWQGIPSQLDKLNAQIKVRESAPRPDTLAGQMQYAAGKTGEFYGADPRSTNPMAQLGRGAGTLLNMAPALMTGNLPAITAQAGAQANSEAYSHAEEQARRSGITDEGEIARIASEAGGGATTSTIPAMAAFMGGGKLASDLAGKLAGESATPLRQGLFGAAGATAANIISSSAIRAASAEPGQRLQAAAPNLENLFLDTAFGAYHGLGVGRNAVLSQGIFGQRNIEVNPPEIAPEPSSEPIGIQNAVTEAERAQLGLPEREAVVARSFPELHAAATETLARDPEAGRRLVGELQTQVRPLTDAEDAVLTLEYARRKQNLDDAYRAVNEAKTPEEEAAAQQRLSHAANENFDAIQVAETAGTANSRGLNARKMMVNEDFSLGKMLAQKQALENNGKPLNEDQIKQVTDQSESIKAAQEGVAKIDDIKADREAQTYHDQLLKEIRKEAQASAKQKRSMTDFFDEQEAAARKRIMDRRGRLNTSIDPLNVAGLVDEAIILSSHIVRGVKTKVEFAKKALSEFGERIRPHIDALFERSKQIAAENSKPFRAQTPEEVLNAAEKDSGITPKLVGDLWLSHIRAGMTDSDAIRKAVHAQLLPAHPSVTERQISETLTKYGKTTIPSQEADQVAFREMKAIERIGLQIQDLQKGLSPLKTGPQRDKTTAKIRELEKTRNDLMRKNGINPTDPATQLASAHTQRVTRLQNTLEELQANIAAGKRTPKTEGVPWTKDELALADKVAEMRQRLDMVLNQPENDKLTGLLARIEAVTERLRTGNIAPKQGNPTADTLAVHEAKNLLTELNRELANQRKLIRNQENPPKTPDERKLRALEKRRDDLMSGKERPGRKLGAETEQQALVRSQIDDLTSQIREAQKVVDATPEARLERDKENIRKRIAETQRRIDSKDYAPKPKPDPVLDREKLNLEYREEELKNQFNQGLLDAKYAQNTTAQKIRHGIAETWRSARTLMTSGDFPPIFRQGLFTIGRPVTAVKAVIDGFKAALSPKQAFRVQREIENRPNAPLYKLTKLYLAKEGGSLTQMEEQYAAKFIKNFPLVGHLVKASERSYVTFLNKIRADTFDALNAGLVRQGNDTLVQQKVIAEAINTFTGRGSLGKMEATANALNTFLFAPRLAMSRFQILAGAPLWKGNAATKRLVAGEYARTALGMTALLGLLKSAGADIELDPRSADFMKARFGKTRIDLTGGLGAIFRFVTRSVTGEKKTQNGKVVSIRNHPMDPYLPKAMQSSTPQFRENDPRAKNGTMTDFVRSKLNPVSGNIWSAVEGRDMLGRSYNFRNAAFEMATPMAWKDVYEAMKEQGVPKGTALGIMGMFGAGMQTYKDR